PICHVAVSSHRTLRPSQGGYVEFILPDPGSYLIATHKFSKRRQGASGLFQPGDVQLPAGTAATAPGVVTLAPSLPGATVPVSRYRLAVAACLPSLEPGCPVFIGRSRRLA